MVKNLPANVGDIRDVGLISGLEDPLKEGMTTTPVFLPGEHHGQRSLQAATTEDKRKKKNYVFPQH